MTIPATSINGRWLLTSTGRQLQGVVARDTLLLRLFVSPNEHSCMALSEDHGRTALLLQSMNQEDWAYQSRR